jgi:hypothetical protein
MITFFDKSIAYIRARRKLDSVFLIAAVALFTIITILNVTNAAIWFDEAFISYSV